MKWTEQQQNAIDAKGSSLIVSAAAGSGKTAVLTERLAKLIADPESGVRADRMIAVTFTNDAASELKKRLDRRLRDLINDDPANTHLLRQQALLQNASISTINSFCFDLLRDNITDQGITSGFGVLDDTDDSVLKAQAMEELLNYYSSNEYEKISFLYDRFCIRDEKTLTEVITIVNNFLSSVTMREKWLEKAVKECSVKFEDSVYFSELLSSAINDLERAYKLSEKCCNMVSMIFPDMTAPQAVKHLVQAEEENDKISKIMDILKSGRLPDEEESCEAITFRDLEKTGKADFDRKIREVYKNLRNEYKKLVIDTLESFRTIESDYQESAEVTKLLVEVIRKYQEIIREKKCAKNSISFDDGERLALELLADTDENGHIVQSETAKRISEYYDIIMIDEYQDSNNKEDMIFKLISHNYKLSPDGEPMYGDNVFLVGDVKQSIYRFRLANPKNFISTLKISEPYTPESTSPNKSIVLNQNFRSSHGVIDFANHVFGQIMTEKCGEIDYAEDDLTLTQIAFIDSDVSSDDDETEDVMALGEKRNAEAVYTAEKISSMLREGAEVITDKGERRPCRPSDFCILIRKNAFTATYAAELEKLGVPVKGKEESGYLRSREIAVLVDMLRIISNPLLDVPMTAVMTSPMYMFSIEEIAYIRALDSSRSIFSVLRELVAGGYRECTDMFLIDRCRDFLDTLDTFRLNSVTMTIGELINSIYDTTDFISVMQLYSDGERKRANLRALIQHAHSYEESTAFEGTGGLGGFLRHIDRVMENGDYVQEKASASSGDYVTIQTFHGSKGLEYPFVFIAETSCNFKRDLKPVVCSDDGRIGYMLYDPKIYRKYKTFQITMLKREMRRYSRSEEMRLLYVGLTRAKQQLFINLRAGETALKKAASQLEKCTVHGGDISWLSENAESFSDWIWASLFRCEGFGEIAQKLGIAPEENELPTAVFGKCFDYVIVQEHETSLFSEKVSENEAGPNEEIVRELSEIIDDRHYDMSLSAMPSKLSVTQITSKLRSTSEPFDFKLKRPSFRFKKGLTGAEKGTAIHTFFQYCDFDKASHDPESEIYRIKEKGYISREQADSINTENVLAFFGSELYSRIRSSVRVWREKKFMVAVSDLSIENEIMERLKKSDGMIKGIIDLMFEEEDGLVIVDYKSDTGVSAQQLAERYSTQLRLYRSAAELTMKKNVKSTYLYSFELQKAIEQRDILSVPEILE